MGSSDFMEKDIQQVEPSFRSIKPSVAAILLIIGAIIAVLFAVNLVLIDETAINQMIESFPELQQTIENTNITIAQLRNVLFGCGIVSIIATVFMVLSGILSWKRKLWGICLVGSMIGLITLFSTVISGILSFIALVLLALSKKEFH